MERSNVLKRDPNGYFSVSVLADALGGVIKYVGGVKNCEVSVGEIVIDSRNVRAGDMFAALIGEHEDGEQYASEAIARGAAAVLCRRGGAERIGAEGIYVEVDDPLTALISAASCVRRASELFVVGVTGSVGKTTVKELCIDLLSERYPTDGTRGNYNNSLGLSLSILNAFSVHKNAEMRGKYPENATRCLVLEMGISRVGEMDVLARIALPEFAVITNIGSMHSEFLGGREGIAREKARIAAQGARRVICPYDKVLLKELSRYVGVGAITDLTVCDSEKVDTAFGNLNGYGIMTEGGEFSMFSTDGSGREYGRFTAPIVGMHGVLDSALAAAVGIDRGLGEDDIRRGLSRYRPASMRQEIRIIGGTVRLIDCYNSGPESVRAALSAMERYSRIYACGRRVAVLGDMLELGEIADAEHYRLGAELFRYGVDLLFTVGDKAKLIADGAVGKGFARSQVYSFDAESSYGSIKEKIESTLQNGDIILYKASRGIGLEAIVI